ncbi:MAG: hypothetical protein SNG10_04265 [Rikenellaceae bacterium]
MNRRIFVITVIFSVTCLSSKAQVDKQVEVTKSYIPEIETATKLSLEPDMVDTVRINPEIDYSITPSSIQSTLSATLYKPATVTYWEFNRPKQAYVKAGLGYPTSSVADVYISNSNPNTNYIIGYLNHEGQYAKLKNDNNEKLSALNSQNRVGVAAGLLFDKRALEGEFSYDVDAWSRYASQNNVTPRPVYQTLAIGGRYGDDFIDFSRWNFDLDISANHMFNRTGDYNTSIGGGVKFGGNLWGGKLISDVGYDYIVGSGDYANNTLLIGTVYTFNTGSWDWGIGAKYYHDGVSLDEQRGCKNYVTPRFTLTNTNNRSFQPFIDVDGEFHRYNYAALVEENPYTLEGEEMGRNNIEYILRGGIRGALGSGKFSYNIYINYTSSPNALYWSLFEVEHSTTNEYSNYYTAEQGRLQAFSVNGDFDYRPIGDMKLSFGGSATEYTTSDYVAAVLGREYANVYMGAEYTIRRVRFGATADLKGVSYTTLYRVSTTTTQETVQIPITLNIKAFAEVTLKNDMVVFMNINNITNSNLYRWMGYREYGVNGMVGVKFQF